MTPAARATALLVAALAGLCAFAAAAAFRVGGAVLRRRAARRESAPRHLRGRQPWPGAEALVWSAGLVVGPCRLVAVLYREDGAPKAALSFASLFLAFSVLIGATQ